MITSITELKPQLRESLKTNERPHGVFVDPLMNEQVFIMDRLGPGMKNTS